MAAHPEMILRTAAICVAYVTFANITCKYLNFLTRVEKTCLAMTHDTPYNSSRNVAFLFEVREGAPSKNGSGRAKVTSLRLFNHERDVNEQRPFYFVLM